MNALLPISYICRVTATFSILGSLSIIYMILSDRERKLVRPYHRLMLMMSIFDVLQSIAFAISVAALPKESTLSGAKGNAHTCTAQGFFVTLGLTVPLYNLSLNIFYVLTIRHRFTSQQFAKLEPAAHVVSILRPFSIAIISTAYDGMIPRGPVCYLGETRLPLLLCLMIIIVCFLTCIISMVCICWIVTSQATRMEQYTNHTRRNGSSTRIRMDEDKRNTIKQACAYASVFILTYTFPIIGIFYVRIGSRVEAPTAVMILSSIFYPLQGFWIFLLYVRPGVEAEMETNPEMSFVRAICDVMLNPESVASRRRRSLGRQSVTSINRARYASARSGSLCQKNELCYGETLNTRELNKAPDNLDESEADAEGQYITICLSEPSSCGPAEDIEHQSKAHSRSTTPKSVSLVEVASSLNDANSPGSNDISIDS